MKTKNPLLQFLPYIKNSKKEYILGTIFSVLNVALGVFGVYVLSKVFDGIEGSITRQIFLKSLTIALGYGLILLCSGISNYIRNIYLVKGANEIYVRIQMQVYDHIQSLPIRYFDNIPAGSVVSRITSDVNQIRTFFVSSFIQIMIITLKILFSYVVLFYVDYRFALFMLLLLPIMYFVLKIYNKLTIDSIKGYRRKFSESNGIINENYQNLEVIKAFNREKASIADWNKHNIERYVYWKKLNQVDSLLLHNITGVFRVILFIGIVYYYAYSNFNNNVFGVTLGMVYLFINYTTDIIYRIADFTMGISTYVRAVGAANNIQEILKLEVEKDIDMQETEDFRGNIEFKNLYFAYNEDDYVLKDINFSLEKGSLCTLLGPSGSGKSTLLNAIGGLEKIDSGSIVINEFEISNLKQKDLSNFRRKYLGFIFQFYNLIPDLTVIENIQVGSFIHNNPMDIEKLIKDLGLWEHRNKYPRQLSGGQQQRCAIGRALIKKPEILLCDEPTGALDYKTSKDILSLLQKINKKYETTIIIATHNEEITKMANIIIRLKDGIIYQNIENVEVIDAQELEW